MSLQTPEELLRSTETLTRLMQQLVGDVERIRGDLATLQARFNAHKHTITVTATTTATVDAGPTGAVTITGATETTPV